MSKTTITHRDISRLQDIIGKMHALLDEAEQIIKKGPHHLAARAESYPIAHIAINLDHDHQWTAKEETLSDFAEQLREYAVSVDVNMPPLLKKWIGAAVVYFQTEGLGNEELFQVLQSATTWDEANKAACAFAEDVGRFKGWAAEGIAAYYEEILDAIQKRCKIDIKDYL